MLKVLIPEKKKKKKEVVIFFFNFGSISFF